MNEKEAAAKILSILKQVRGDFVCLRDLARNAGFKGAQSKEFKAGFRLLESEKIVRLYHSGWPSEGYHRTMVVLLADIYAVEDIEKELKKDDNWHEEDPLTPESQLGDFELVAILTPMGQKSYISKSAYKAERNLSNFWEPINPKAF